MQVDAVAGIRRVSGWNVPVGAVSRFEFYDRARAAFAVLVTSEHRLYGCLLLGKGVLPEPTS
ncbi:RbsD/FucU domain-containing protein [Fodinicola feengrottensis]|uniref:RbsD/FucU domain-containing protein n=1 Tax=Fodinicola feengrottensis TaxID=435914 RepID=UPI0036F2181B